MSAPIYIFHSDERTFLRFKAEKTRRARFTNAYARNKMSVTQYGNLWNHENVPINSYSKETVGRSKLQPLLRSAEKAGQETLKYSKNVSSMQVETQFGAEEYRKYIDTFFESLIATKSIEFRSKHRMKPELFESPTKEVHHHLPDDYDFQLCNMTFEVGVNLSYYFCIM